MVIEEEPRSTLEGGATLSRRRWRWDLALFALVVAGPVLALLAWVAVRQDVRDLEERLVRDANGIFGATHPRPVHVEAPLPGSTGDFLARHLPVFEAEEKGAEEEAAALRAVLAGERPPSALPARYVRALGRLGPDLEGLLAGARAERADFPEGGDPALPMAGASWAGFQRAMKLAAARVRVQLAAGDRQGALRTCLDALGLGRDATISRGLIGAVTGAAATWQVGPGCASALDGLGRAELEDAARRLRTVRDAFPPFSATYREETVVTQLMAGKVLAPSVGPSLVPRARALHEQGGPADPAWFERLAARDGWRALRAAQDAAVAAADLPDAERQAALEAVNASLLRNVDPFAAVALPDFTRFLRRVEDGRRRLDALVAAAQARAFRLERGRWPASAAELRAAGRLEEREVERTDLRLEPVDGGLRVEAPLLAAPDGSDRVSYLLSAPGRGGG